MAKIDRDLIGKLTKGLDRPERLREAAILAGTGLGMPFATLRARAAKLELQRIETRFGAKSSQAVRQQKSVAALARNEAALQQQLDQRRAPLAALGEGEASLSGRITRSGKPLLDVTVSILDQDGKSLRQTCTGRDGRYTVALPSDTDVRVELREGEKRVFRDKEGVAYPAGYVANRDIDVAAADPVCDSIPPEDTDTVYIPALVGLTVGQARKTIEALGLNLAKVEEKPSDNPGVILAQKPEAGVKVGRDQKVSLVVGSKEGWTAGNLGDVTGKTLNEALKQMERAKVGTASVTLVGKGGQTPIIRKADVNATGDAVHLVASVANGDAAVIDAVATFLAASDEGRQLGLDSDAKAVGWLQDAKVGSLAELHTAAAESDVELRKRLSLGAKSGVTDQRRALLAVVARVR